MASRIICRSYNPLKKQGQPLPRRARGQLYSTAGSCCYCSHLAQSLGPGRRVKNELGGNIRVRTGFGAPRKRPWGSRGQETQPWPQEAYPLKGHSIYHSHYIPQEYTSLQFHPCISRGSFTSCVFFSVFPYGKKLFLIRSGSPESKTLPSFLCIPQDSAQMSPSFVLTSGSSQLFPTVQVHRFILALV